MSALKSFTNYCITATKWFMQELLNWWQIGKLERRIKSLKRRRESSLSLNTDKFSSIENSNTLSKNYEYEAEKLEKQIELLKERVWALTPTILFVTIAFIFFLGIVFLAPRTDLNLADDKTHINKLKAVFAPPAIAPVVKTLEYPIEGYNVVKTAVWLNNKLYIGGDGGLTCFDPETATSTLVAGLPNSMFVRDLAVVKGKRLLIAGYGGIFELEGSKVQPLYDSMRLPIDLVNKIAFTDSGNLIIGTIGHGLFLGRNDTAFFLLGTKGITPSGFAYLKGELWVAHERGILKGDGNTFETLQIPILGNRIISCLAATDSAIYLGTDRGLVVGTKSLHGWTWTLIDPGEPLQIHAMDIIDGKILICSEEGLFRYYEGSFEKLAGNLGQTALAVTSKYAATVGPDRIIIHIFSQEPAAVSMQDMPKN